jgi:transcription-repair coupling factor (superfamily II helicase)
LYNELSLIKDEKALADFEAKLTDRFGTPPKPALALLNSIRIKWIATRTGIEKLVMKQAKMIGYFISDQQSGFYQSNRFTKLLEFVQKHPELCKIKEKQTQNGLRLMLTFDNIKSIKRALETLEKMEL